MANQILVPPSLPERSDTVIAAGATSHGGYSIALQFEHLKATDAPEAFSCRLTATPLGEHPSHASFERTLVVSGAEAVVTNAVRPGTMPPLDQLQADLERVGIRYVALLIDAVNHGFAELASRATQSVSEAWSRCGMTDQALRIRER